jgi:hypothetical protein
MRPVYLLLPVMLAAAACAPQSDGGFGPMASDGPKQCFRSSQVSGFSDAGPDLALVNLGGRETWELALSPGCPDVDFAMRLGIRARGGSDRICSGTDAELLIPPASGRGLQRCLVRSVRRLSPEEMAVARGETQRR